MYGFYLFIHLLALSVWLGSIVAVAVMLASMKRQLQSVEVSGLARKTVRIFNMLTHPSAFLVLMSGGLMMIEAGMSSDKPFWLAYMERVGGMTILLFIVVISIMGKRLVKRIIAENDNPLAAMKSVTSYVTGLTVSSALVMSVIFMVSVKL